jgi:hypothetical protein
MSTKTKNTKTKTDALGTLAQQAGLILMTAAMTIGMVEMPDEAKRAVVPHQPAFAFAGTEQGGNDPNSIRREREETGPHYISYSVAQRTPGRTGRA